MLHFTVPGPFVSGNHAKTKDGRRTAASRAFDAKVAIIARMAVRSAKWDMPDYVRMEALLINVRADIDNILKEINDPLQGIVFAHDSRVLDIHAVKRHAKPATKQEVHLWFWPVDGTEYGYARPRARR